MQDGILSIQSHVAYGHVGNSAAVFPLQRQGFEVWPVNTVLFSNHTGYGAWRGRPVELDWVREVIDGMGERGALPRTRALLSGYLGAPELGDLVLEVLARIRRERADVIYACDPVMGDEGRGFFVKPGLPEFFRDKAILAADLITPNQFELAFLAGRSIASVEDTLTAAAAVRRAGPRIVVCTSLMIEERPNELAVLADTEAGSWIVWTPRLDVNYNGTGDAFTALFLGAFLRSGDPARALSRATSAMYGLVARTHAAQSRELVLVAAQEEFVEPTRPFETIRLR
jgi:pyridoxine kinase